MNSFAGFNYPKQAFMMNERPIRLRLVAFKRERKIQSSGYYMQNPAPNQNGKLFYLGSDFCPNLRWSWCDKVDGSRIDHTGWFTDEYGDSDKVHGFVMRLPHGRGFIPGWSYGNEMIAEVEYDIYDDEAECAYRADKMAERIAESERERDYKAYHCAEYGCDNQTDYDVDYCDDCWSEIQQKESA